MVFIDEVTIDRAADALSSDEALHAATLQQLQEEQGVVLAYLFTENTELLNQQEREYLLYLVLVIWRASQQLQKTFAEITAEDLSIAEEHNWEKLEAVTAKRFRERLDGFFADTPQEDLLAFVEDALVEEEDGFVTKEGREPIFIILKTIIDCLHAAGDATVSP